MKMLKINDSLTMIDENHLGGFIAEGDPATFTPGLWKYLVEKYNAKSVIDVGCGMGFSVKEFLKYTTDVVGIDGSEYVAQNSSLKDYIKHIDFTKTKYVPEKIYDLCWSCEFVEHVEEQFMDNYFEVFKNSRYCAITYAGIGQDGHHHVNCQPKEYWIDKFKSYGLDFLENETMEAKEVALEDSFVYNPYFYGNHFYDRGLIFKNNGKS